jgi:hypothetical protein
LKVHKVKVEKGKYYNKLKVHKIKVKKGKYYNKLKVHKIKVEKKKKSIHKYNYKSNQIPLTRYDTSQIKYH